jgi:predicted MFS family arabinose efflux permease
VRFLKSMRSLGPRYMALWVGQTISQFGTYIAYITLPLLILYIHDAAGDTNTIDYAFAYAAETAPTFLVGLVGGVLLDRIHLRPVMIAADLLRASAFFYLVAQYGTYSVGTVFAIAFIVGSMTTMFDGALYAMIPALVPERRLSDANAFVTASIQANFALGPLVGGFITFAFAGPEIGLFINGLTFIASAISLKFVGRVAHHTDVTEKRPPLLTEFTAGMRRILDEPRLRISTISAAVPNFVMGFMEATFVVLFTVVIQTETETQIGILLFFMGLGGLVGALVAPDVTRAMGLGRAMISGLTLAGVALLAFMFTTYGIIAMLLLAVFMFGVSVINIPLATIRQIYAGEGMLGRVITAARAIGWATLPIGALVGGWLGNTEATYPWVARLFPLILLGCALWLFTTVIWTDTYGPEYRTGSHEKAKTPRQEKKAPSDQLPAKPSNGTLSDEAEVPDESSIEHWEPGPESRP